MFVQHFFRGFFPSWPEIWLLKSRDKSLIKTQCLFSSNKRFTSCSLSNNSEILKGNIFLFSYPKTFTEISGFSFSNSLMYVKFTGNSVPSKFKHFAFSSNCLVIRSGWILKGLKNRVTHHLSSGLASVSESLLMQSSAEAFICAKLRYPSEKLCSVLSSEVPMLTNGKYHA